MSAEVSKGLGGQESSNASITSETDNQTKDNQEDDEENFDYCEPEFDFSVHSHKGDPHAEC